MNLPDINEPGRLKVISLIMLCILGLLIIRSLLSAWEIPIQLKSPVIPQSFVKKLSGQFLLNGLIMLAFFIPGVICWRLKRHKATIIISTLGYLGHLIHFNYFWL